MSRKSQPTRDPDADGDGDTETTTAEDIQTQSALDKEALAAIAIEELMGDEKLADGRCRVTRRGQTESEFVWIESVPVSGMKPDLFEFLSTRYGGGRYELWFFLPGGKYYSRKTITIDYRIAEGEFFRVRREQQQQPSTGDGLAVNKLVDKLAAGDGSQTLILTFLKMSQEQSALMLQNLMQSNAQTLTAIASMVAALKSGEAKPAFNMLEAIAVFDKLKAKDNSIDPLRMFEVLHKWIRDNQGNGEEPEPWWLKPVQAIAPVLLGKIAPQLAEQPGQQTPQAQPQPQPALSDAAPDARPTAPANPGPASTTEPEADPMNIIFLTRMIRAKLLAQIEAGATPQDAIDLVYNPLLLTDEQVGKLEAVILREDWIKELLGDFNLTAPQRAWLDEFKRLMLNPPSSQDPEVK